MINNHEHNAALVRLLRDRLAFNGEGPIALTAFEGRELADALALRNESVSAEGDLRTVRGVEHVFFNNTWMIRNTLPSDVSDAMKRCRARAQAAQKKSDEHG